MQRISARKVEIVGWTVGGLALIGIGASAAHYLSPPYNPGFIDYPTIVALHIGLGAVFLAFAPWQFVRRIRLRWRGYHRWSGRVLVAIGLVVGASGVFMGLVIPMSGNWERVNMGVFGSLFFVELSLGLYHIRAGHTAAHREWMIRAFAIGLAIATMRVIFIPALLLAHNPTEQQVAMLSNSAFLAAFSLHAVLAELWIRATRPNGASSRTPLSTPGALPAAE